MKQVISDIKISNSVKKNACAISLEGELTLRNVAAIKKELIKALGKCDSLQLSVHNVTSIDLSWIQLFHSLRKTCKDSGKNITIEMMLNPDTELLFTRTGFGSLLKSSESNNQTIR
jgi:anti-anti-sigma factor